MAGSPLDAYLDRADLISELTSPADPDVPPDWSPLGMPLITADGRADHFLGELLKPPILRVVTTRTTIRDAVTRAIADLSTQLRRDVAVMDAVGLARRRTTPWAGLKPGEFAQLRALLLTSLIYNTEELARMSDTEPAAALRAVEAAGTGLQLIDAVPCFIPAGIAEALMTSDAPDEQLVTHLRLPFPSVLVFFDAIPLGVLDLGRVLTDGSSDTTIDDTNMSLIGVRLSAGPGGLGLDPIAEWILTTPTSDTHPPICQAGFWRHSTQPGVITNIAALCTWARWHAPVETPRQLEGEIDSRTWRRSLERSAVRKAIARGAILGVNVVDLGALHNNHTPATETSTHRGVKAHWRRGFWNSVRIATRDADGNIIGDRLGQPNIDWHYEGRWIHPVLVNGEQPENLTIYRVNRQHQLNQ